MKPIRLSMEAFGPYAERTDIDFRCLDRGLFLITGNTGSGKTMIFDAMCYALYGETSGDRRRAEMLRSDLTDTKPWVELEFEHRGTRYVVRREPPYSRVNRKGNITNETAKAEIFEDGRPTFGKPKEVTARVTEVLGLDCDQWKQVSMLAQGEFVDLLDTESKERTAIMRRLFSTDRFMEVQGQLDKIYKEKRQAYESRGEDIEEHMSEAVVANPLSGMTRDAAREELGSAIEADEAEMARLVEARAAAENAHREAIEARTRGETLVSRFSELEEAKAGLEGLRSKDAEIAGLAARRDRAAGIAPVVSVRDALRVKEMDLATVMDRLRGTEDALAEARDRSETSARSLEAARTEKEAADGLAPACDRIERGLPSYGRAAALERELETSEMELRRVTSDVSSMRESIGSLEADAERLRGIVDGSSDALASLERARAELVAAQDRAKALEEARAMAVRCLDADKRVAELESGFEAANSEASRLARELESAESLFMRSQAGLLASALREGEPCPVCGSTHHPSPACVPDDVPSEEAVESLRRSKAEADGARSSTAERLAAARAEASSLLERVSSVTGIDAGASGQADALDGICAEAKSSLREAAHAVSVAEAAVRGMEDARIKLRSREEELAGLKSSADAYDSRVQEMRVSSAAKHAELESLRPSLEYPDEATARRELGAMRARMSEAAQALSVAERESHEAESAVTALAAEAAGFGDRVSQLEPAIAADRDTLGGMLAERGMDAEELDSLAGFDVAEANRAIEEHASRRRSLSDAVARLEAETSGIESPDMEALGLAVESAAEARRGIESEQAAVGDRLRRNRSVASYLEEKWAELDRCAEELQAVKAMSDVANGQLTGSRKVTFEQYVQTAFFDAVLVHANGRLGEMSGGRFELVRRTETDNRSQSALDIDVVDNFTGKTRSVRSLSGGESFKAALSLALGLSDAVQMSAGGIRVETLFIDEGFGSLDSDSLQQAIRVLERLTMGDVMVGVISHVDLLRERIDRKIEVTRTKTGSRVEVVTD